MYVPIATGGASKPSNGTWRICDERSAIPASPRCWYRSAHSQASAVVVLVAGAVTGVQSAKLQQGKPTPRLGLYERTSMGAWMAWMAALAAILLREQKA